jgi:hypothetical protein
MLASIDNANAHLPWDMGMYDMSGLFEFCIDYFISLVIALIREILPLSDPIHSFYFSLFLENHE